MLLFFAYTILWINLPPQSASDIVRKADAKMRGNTSHVQMTIKITRPAWTREMQVKAWMMQPHYAMILIQSPARDKGIVFLKRNKEVWNWIPTLERIVKLPPSMMSQSWMGTDFTNDDLVKESSVVEDYEHHFAGDTIIDNRPCYKISFIPKPTTAVVWSRLLVCIDKNDLIELYTEFFDEEGKLINTMKADDVKMMDGRLIPTHMVMIPSDKKNQKTEIFYQTILFDKKLNENLFTIENMKRVY